MNDQNIDEILGRTAGEVDPALLSRISSSLGSTIKPVRPIAPAWMLASALLLATAAVALFCAFCVGFAGIQKMTIAAIAIVFPALAIFAALAALTSVSTMRPGGSPRPLPLMLIALAGWIAASGFVFRDYSMGSFVAQGIPCLRAGLAVAIPSGIVTWLILRRGFAVDATAAGLAAGTLAGLAGLAMLELHCPVLLAPHIMLWHSAVVPISALAGALLAHYAASRHRNVLD
jgi:hypothetical protein